MAYEEANYKVVQKFENFEIRSYQERYVIQVRYNNEDGGFQKLFNYISGKNQKSEKIEKFETNLKNEKPWVFND